VCVIKRGCFYILIGLAAAGGLIGCAQTYDIKARAAPRFVSQMKHVAVPKSNSTKHFGDTYRLDVIGLAEYEIHSRLGSSIQDLPHLPALEVIFVTDRCTLNVTLYPDIRTRVYHALAYEVVGDADTPKERRRCSAAFAARLHRKSLDRISDTSGHG